MRAAALFLLLAACGQKAADAPVQKPQGAVKWKTAYSAAECKSLASPEAVVKRCYGGNLDTGRYVGDTQCWPFSEARRFRGLWVIDLEASEFYPNVTGYGDEERSETWLATDLLERRPELLAAAQGAGRRVYSVVLEGRQALCDGSFGHMGMYPQQITVEQFYAMRRLPPP